MASSSLLETSEMSVGRAAFNPRLRLDLSSGKGSLRSLRESVGKLPGVPKPPRPAEEGAFASMPPVMDYEKTIALMRGRHTHDMHDRHLLSLREIAGVNARGFFLHDVGSARELLRLAAERAAVPNLANEYEAATCGLLGALSVPFQKNRSNDDLRFEEDVLSLVRLAADLALQASPLVAACALEMVLALAVPPPPPTSTAEGLAREALTAGPRIASLKVLLDVIKAGAVPAIVGAVGRAVAEATNGMGSSSRGGSHLGTPPRWERPTLAAMRLLRALSRQPDGAAAILSAEDLPAVLSRLALPLGQPMLSMVVETVWNLLEADPAAAAEALATRETIGLIVDLHERSLIPGACDADCELRNEVLVLSTLLAKSCDNDGRNALVRNGLYHAALGVVCTDTARMVSPSEINLELLLLAMQFLLVMSKDPEGVSEAAPYADDAAGLTDTLLECLQPYDEYEGAGGGSPLAFDMWSASQRRELQKRAFKLLTNLAVARPESISEAQPASIAAVLGEYLRPDAPPELRDASIHLLVAALPLSPGLQAAAGEAGLAAQLIELVAAISYCAGPTSLAPFSTTVVPTTSALRVPTGLTANSMQAAVLALGLLCADQPVNQARFGDAGGVACLLPLIKPRTDAALLHSVIECIWSAVVPSATNLSKLVQREGVLLLLAVLEGAPFAPRAHVLPCLADLVTSSPEALEQCREWHGAGRQSAVQLCLQLWQEESARRGDAAGDGRVVSTQRPLTKQSQQMYAHLNASLVINDAVDIADAANSGMRGDALKITSRTSLAIGGRLEGVGGSNSAALEKVDVRSKLFAVLSALNFKSSVPLDDAQSLVMTAAREYVPLAASEAWRDTVDELAAEGTDPLPEDLVKLEARLAADEKMTEGVMAKQSGIVDTIEADELAEDTAELKRVRVLRDGPMGQVASPRRGTSLFRARIEAKARIGAMVASSKVGFRGPMPIHAEYADATVQAATEAMKEAGADPEVTGFTLRHVPQALATLATAAAVDASYINPFLTESGVGLTVQGQPVADEAKLRIMSPTRTGATLQVMPLAKDAARRVMPTELRRLCIEFLEYAAEWEAQKSARSVSAY